MTQRADEEEMQRFPITFDSWSRVLMTLLGLPASRAYVDVRPEDVEVRMGWAFRSRFPRSAIVSAGPIDLRPLSRGVHGYGGHGHWLVNGSGRGILRVRLSPAQRAYTMGLPIRLQELLVSVREPVQLATALTPSR